MSLVQCGECGQQINRMAVACPYCGVLLRKGLLWWAWPALVVALLALLPLGDNGGGGSNVDGFDAGGVARSVYFYVTKSEAPPEERWRVLGLLTSAGMIESTSCSGEVVQVLAGPRWPRLSWQEREWTLEAILTLYEGRDPEGTRLDLLDSDGKILMTARTDLDIGPPETGSR